MPHVLIVDDERDLAELIDFNLRAAGFSTRVAPSGEAALQAWHVPEEEWDSRDAALPPSGATGPRLFFARVPEPKTVKNRLHLDVRAAPGLAGEERMAVLEAEAERLVGLGGTRLQRHEPGGLDAGHLVMADPEGNEFCLD